MLATLACFTAAFSPIVPARAPPRAHARASRGHMGLFDFMKGDGEPVSAADPEAVPRGMCAASHILLATAEEAEALKARLDAGELTFEDAAIEFSTCPSGKKGGDLGNLSCALAPLARTHRPRREPEFRRPGMFRSIGDLLFLPYEGDGARTWLLAPRMIRTPRAHRLHHGAPRPEHDRPSPHDPH